MSGDKNFSNNYIKVILPILLLFLLQVFGSISAGKPHLVPVRRILEVVLVVYSIVYLVKIKREFKQDRNS